MPTLNTPPIYWHADDLGLSTGITQSIADCFDVLNSVSVIVNGTDTVGAVDAVRAYDKKYPENPMRVVLHLNFMEGIALSGKSVICPTGIFDKDFLAFWRFAYKNRHDKIGFQDAIYAETLHQIRVFEKAFGYTPPVVDSHQHMHMIPIIAQGVAKALSEAGISQIRIPSDCIWVRSPFVNMGKYALLKFLTWKTHPIWHAHDIGASSTFFGVLPTGTANLDIYTPALRYKTALPLEILFHPGKARATEYEIWRNRPALWAYYNAPQRDAEAHTLRKVYLMNGTDNV